MYPYGHSLITNKSLTYSDIKKIKLSPKFKRLLLKQDENEFK